MPKVQILATGAISKDGIIRMPRNVAEVLGLTGPGTVVYLKDDKPGIRIVSADTPLELIE